MRRIAFVAGLAIALGCGGARPQTPVSGSPPLSSPTTGAPQPAPPAPTYPPPPPPAPAALSTCEAPSLAYLVGKPRTMIPVPVDLSNRRVSCATCPVTQDYRPERTDILFDANTGLITEVKCG